MKRFSSFLTYKCFHKISILRPFVLALILSALSAKAESPHFPVPDIIKPNVAFWIRIYTEIGLKEGLLHDREHPQITYEKVVSGNRTGRARSDYIDSRRQIYVNAIATIRDSTPEKWGAVEKRVAELFKNAPEGALDSAEFRIRHQTGQRERFKAGLERSGAYIDTIAAILKQHGVPEELKYLPHVESSFDAEAYSKAGAAGLWQFMRSTGRGYMRVDYMIDERSDPIISTGAAARFLRANYDLLKAWPLAVTAYNHGPNGMRRAVESVGSRDIADILQKHESPSFKFASKNFYSCFVAVLEIMENPEKYFRNINYKPKWEATSVAMPSAMTPNTVLRVTGVTEREFRRMNPSFRPVVFSQQRTIPAGYHINLPKTISADSALAALKRTAPPLPQRPAPVAAASPSTVRTSPRPAAPPPVAVGDGEESYYTVVRGDNLIAISRRLGVPMSELAAANNITNSSRIYVGQVLRIPGTTAEAEDAALPVIAERIVDTVQTVTAVKVADTAKVVDTATVVTAIAGDTLSTEDTLTVTAPTISNIAITVIPFNYDTAWVRIVDTSNLLIPPADKIAVLADTSESDVAYADTAKTATVAILPTVATAIAVPAPEPISPAGTLRKPSADTRFDATTYELGITIAADSKSVRIRVSVDETIGHFSEWMRVDAATIRNTNNIAPNTSLQLGKTIVIPVTSPRNIKRFETNRLQYHMAIEEDFFARYDIVDFEQRKIRSGDNLWKLCAEAQIPMWLFKKFNRHVKSYDLRLGDNVWIPKTSPKDGGSHEVIDVFDPVVTETDAE